MSAEVLARAFEPFYSTQGERGTGLGLAICKQIIGRTQAPCVSEDAPSEGTTVTWNSRRPDTPDLAPLPWPA